MAITGNNTTVKNRDGDLVVTLHKTDIVRVHGEFVTLNTGGWFTAVTKHRMNETLEALGIKRRVAQAKGKWYVRDIGSLNSLWVAFQGNTITFQHERA